MGGVWRRLEIEGERKTLHEWSKDPRCEIGYKRLRTRLKSGNYRIRGRHRFDPAILRAPSPRKREERPLTKPRRFYEYEGDRMTLAEWARDPRCGVARTTLIHRMKKGWPFERALLTPSLIPPRDPV